MCATALVLSFNISKASTNEINQIPIYSTNIPAELSTLCKAIMSGDVDMVKKLIELGEDVNEKSLGMTPAIFAARYNKAEILKVLIDNGADLKIKCNKGFSIKKHAQMSNAKDALEVIEKASARSPERKSAVKKWIREHKLL